MRARPVRALWVVRCALGACCALVPRCARSLPESVALSQRFVADAACALGNDGLPLGTQLLDNLLWQLAARTHVDMQHKG